MNRKIGLVLCLVVLVAAAQPALALTNADVVAQVNNHSSNLKNTLRTQLEATMLNNRNTLRDQLENTMLNNRNTLRDQLQATMLNNRNTLRDQLQATMLNNRNTLRAQLEDTMLNNRNTLRDQLENSIENARDTLRAWIEAKIEAEHEATRMKIMDEHTATRMKIMDEHDATRMKVMDEHQQTRDELMAKLSFQIRTDIEYALKMKKRLGIYFLPQASGGRLEQVAAIVQDTINKVNAAGQGTNGAQSQYNLGVNWQNANQYKTAFDFYCRAYCLATAQGAEIGTCF